MSVWKIGIVQEVQFSGLFQIEAENEEQAIQLAKSVFVRDTAREVILAERVTDIQPMDELLDF